MTTRHPLPRSIVCLLLVAISGTSGRSETLYVDIRTGNDGNPATRNEPLKSLERAAVLVNGRAGSGYAIIIVGAGLYSLSHPVTFAGSRTFTEQDRLTIRASILPDDPQWRPDLMPVLASVENPSRPPAPGRPSETYSLKVQTSHVTIQGLKFLGNPLAYNWHCCIERIGEHLDDLLVTQCVFAGNRDTSDIYCAALATGDRFIVDHCTFSGCHACTVFWDGADGVGGQHCAMRYCIVRNARISAVWTCQTADDLEFYHNIVGDSEYLWMRKPGDRQTYRIEDCVAVDNRCFSGYGVASGPTGQTGPEVTFERSNVITEGDLAFVPTLPLRVAQDSVGANLGAGLFRTR